MGLLAAAGTQETDAMTNKGISMQATFRALFGVSTLCTGLVLASNSGAEAQKAHRRASGRSVRSVGYGGAGSASGIEKSLLGIRILQSYRQVLARYGQPTRIYRLGEVLDFIYDTDANGKYTGGITGLGDTNSGGGGGSSNSGKAGGPPAGYGPPGGGGGYGPYSGPPSGGGSRGGYSPSGGGGGGYGPYSGPPGGGGPPAGYGPPGGGGGGGLNNLGGGQQENTFKASGGYIWVYLYPDKRCTGFVFNRSGRCEAILELGRFNGQPTSRGVNLGSRVDSVYKTYGWPDTSEFSPQGTSLYYNNKYHLQFVVLNNKVVGILVVLGEEQKYKTAKADNGGGAGPGGPGGGGRPGGKGAAGGAAAATGD